MQQPVLPGDPLSIGEGGGGWEGSVSTTVVLSSSFTISVRILFENHAHNESIVHYCCYYAFFFFSFLLL